MEDDSVFVEGTPLANYFKQMGMDECIVSLEDEEEKVAPTVKSQSILGRTWKHIRSAVKSVMSNPLRNTFQGRCIDIILNAEMIGEYDLDILLQEKGISRVSDESLKWVLMKKGVRDILMAILPIVAVEMTAKKSIGLKLLALMPTIFICSKWTPVMGDYKSYCMLKSYVHEIKTYYKYLSKSMRIVNESNYINRGFMLNSQHLAAALRLEKPTLESITNMSTYSLPGLRMALRRTSMRMAYKLAAVTKAERVLRPLRYSLDHPALCLPPIEDESDEDDEIPQVCDIKKWIEHFYDLQKEYLWRALFYIVGIENDGEELCPINETVVSELRLVIADLKTEALVYEAIFKRQVECKIDILGENQPIDRMGAIHSMFHNAKGHLKEALRDAILVEESLENPSLDLVNLSNLLTLSFEKLLYHIRSTEDCLSRAEIVLKAAEDRDSSRSNLSVNGAQQTFSDELDEGEEKTLHPRAPVPADEVFELVVEGTDSANVTEQHQGEDAHPECKDSQLMIRELKTVIRAKAEDWERRERRLKEKALGISLPVEDSMGMECDQGAVGISSAVLPLIEAHVTDGYQASSSMSSWVTIPPNVESEADGSSSHDEAGHLNPDVAGRLAKEAVAKARSNRELGMLMSDEEEFCISGED